MRGRAARLRRRRRRAPRSGAATRGARSLRRAARRAPPSRTRATSASLISCSESPAAMRTRMNVFIRSRDGRVGLVERRLADRADELRLEVGGVRRRGSKRTRAASDAEHDRERATRGSRLERLFDRASSSLGRTSSPSTPPLNAATTRPSRSITKRLREAGDAEASSAVARPVVDEREGEPEPVGEPAARRRGSPSRRARRRRGRGRDCRATALRGTAPRPCTGCTTTPRS